MAKAAEKEPPVESVAEDGEELVTLDTGAVEEAEGPVDPPYEPPKVTPTAKKTATKVYGAVRDADILGPGDAVSALLQMIDILPVMTPPDEWPGPSDEEYHEAPVVGEMAAVLIKGCAKLTVKPHDIVFLWRNKEKWMAGGKTVRGNAKTFPTRVRHLLDGKKACVEINYHHFKTLNPLQRTFALYHELRLLDAAGSIQKPDFHGFYDEIEIFGPRVFRDMMELSRVMELGEQVTHPHQLPLWEE